MTWHDPLDAEMLERGHPSTELDNGNVIFLCANCERMRTVLFLSKDRWLCTSCRNEGDARPVLIPLTKPT